MLTNTKDFGQTEATYTQPFFWKFSINGRLARCAFNKSVPVSFCFEFYGVETDLRPSEALGM